MVNPNAGLTNKNEKRVDVTLLVIGRFNLEDLQGLEVEGVEVLSLEAEEGCVKLSLKVPASSALTVLKRIDSSVKRSDGLLIPALEAF